MDAMREKLSSLKDLFDEGLISRESWQTIQAAAQNKLRDATPPNQKPQLNK